MSSTTPPAVSVVLPTRRWDRLLDRAVGSVIAQSLPGSEILVVDDSDGARAGHRSWWRAHRDVRILPNDGRGLVDALNTGIHAARAEWIARMDGDDVAHPDRLRRQLTYLHRNPAVDVVGTQALAVTVCGEALHPIDVPTSHHRIVERLVCGETGLIHPATMMRRSLVLEVGGYAADLPGAEDLDLWLRLADRARFANLNRRLLLYTVHGGQVTQATPGDGARTARRYAAAGLSGIGGRAGHPPIAMLLALEESRLDAEDPMDRLAIDVELFRRTGASAFLHRTRGEIGTLRVRGEAWRPDRWVRRRVAARAEGPSVATAARLATLLTVDYAWWVARVRYNRWAWRTAGRHRWGC